MVSAILTNDIVSQRKKELEQIQKPQVSPQPELNTETLNISSDNLFNGADTTAQISFSETEQPSVSENLFGTNNINTSVPNQNMFEGDGGIDSITFNAMKKAGGTIYREAKQMLGSVGSNIWNNALEEYREQEQGKTFYESAVKPQTDAYKAMAEGLAWSAIRGVKDFSVTVGAYTGRDDLSEEYEWLEKNTALGQRMSGETDEEEYVKFIREASNQIGYMLPTWFMSALTKGKGIVANLSQVAVLYPGMFSEAYEQYADLDAPEWQKKAIASIVALLNSEIELGFGIEGVAKGLLSKSPKLLNTLLNVAGEGGEEALQGAIIKWGGMFMGGEAPTREEAWEDFLEASKYAGIFMGADIMIDTGIKKEIEAKKKKDEEEKDIAVNNYLNSAAKQANTFDDFKAMVEPFNVDEEELNKVWKDANATTEEGIQKVFASDTEYQSYLDTQEDEKLYNEAVDNYSEAVASIEQYKEQKTLEEIQEEVSKVKQTQEYQELQERLADAAVRLVAGTNESPITSTTVTFSTPKLVDGKYVSNITQGVPQGELGRYVKPESTRGETETELKRDNADYQKVRKNVQAVESVISKLNESLNKGDEASKEDVMMVYDALEGDLAGKEGIIYRLQNRGLMSAIKYARGVRQSLLQQQTKISNKIARQAWKYVYRLQQESTDNEIIGYSDFVLKNYSKTKTSAYTSTVKSALIKMSDMFHIDMSKVFEGCKIIFLDYHGMKKQKKAWGSMEIFIDGDGTPIIPISFNYIGFKESTIIHELTHAMDAVYSYRHGGVSIEPGVSKPYPSIFSYVLSQEKGLYNELLRGMTYGEGRLGYWTKPTEVMARVFQEYYEVKTARTEEAKTQSLIDTWHWENFDLVTKAVNNLSDLFREEFGMPPRPNESDSLEEYINKINEVVDSFNNEGTIDFFEALKNVGDQMISTKEKLESMEEGEEKKQVEAFLSELESQWDNLMAEGMTYSDMVGGKEAATATNEEMKIEDIENMLSYQLEGDKEPADLVTVEKTVNKEINTKDNKDLKRAISGVVKDTITPIMSRLFNISPRLAGSMAIMEGSTMAQTAEYNKEIKGFVDKMKGLDKKAKEEFKKLWINYGSELNLEDMQEIKDKYGIDLSNDDYRHSLMKEVILKFADDHGFKKELEDVFKTIDKISEEYIAAGLRLHKLDLYLPREVKDIDVLSNYLKDRMIKGMGDTFYKNNKDLIEKLQRISIDKNTTSADKNRMVRNIFEELNDKIKAATQSSHHLKRSITGTKDWGDELIAYYEDPEVSIVQYIQSMVERTERAKFWGRGIGLEGMEEIYAKAKSLGIKLTPEFKGLIHDFMRGEDPETVIKNMINEMGVDKDTAEEMIVFINDKYNEETETSISNIINRLTEDKELGGEGLSPEKAEEIEHLLTSYFKKRATPNAVQMLKNWTYIAFLGDLNSTIKQLADLGFSVATSPTQTMKAMYKIAAGKADVTARDLGIDNLFEDIAQERENIWGNILGIELKASGFRKVDIGMKTVLLQTKFDTMHKHANSKGHKADILKTRLHLLYGENMGNQIFDAYKSGLIRTDNKLIIPVMVDLGYLLGESQPLFKSSMPVAYNNNIFARFLYSLKTYSMKAFDYIIQGTKRMKQICKTAGLSNTESNLRAAKYAAGTILIMATFEEMVQQLQILWNTLRYFVGLGGDDDEWSGSFLYKLIYGDSKDAANQLLKDMKYNILQYLTIGIVSQNSVEQAKWKGLSDILGSQTESAIIRPVSDFISMILWMFNVVLPQDYQFNRSLVQSPVRALYYLPMIGRTAWGQGVSELNTELKKWSLWGEEETNKSNKPYKKTMGTTKKR